MNTAIAAAVEGNGPAVLLLHGQPGSAADWAGVRAALRSRFTVVAPDRPGYGETGGAADGMAGNASAMIGLMDELGIPNAIVAGHSWGAGVALALAQRSPDRVTRLVLVCPVTPADRLGVVDRMLATRKLGAAATRVGFWAAGAALSTALAQQRVERALPGFGAEHSAELARAWRRGPLWRSFYREQTALFDELPTLREGLARMSTTTTVVIGSNDRITPPSVSRRFAASIGAGLVEVPHGGHLLPMQAPSEVADAIAGGR
ncbi:MAG: hypothetical protein NVSMB25_00510 [Thermoleophilaceae bacterium]